jgi:hypothetical protein
MVRMKGIMAIAEMYVVTRGSGGKFGHVESAEIDRPGIVKSPENCCRKASGLLVKNETPSRGDLAFAVEEIFVSKRYSV